MPKGAVIVMLPVAVVQLGCMAANVGVAGAEGAVFITCVVIAEIQPAAFFAVML